MLEIKNSETKQTAWTSLVATPVAARVVATDVSVRSNPYLKHLFADVCSVWCMQISCDRVVIGGKEHIEKKKIKPE